MEELIKLVHLLILALVMEEEWLLELDYLYLTYSSFSSTQQEFMVLDAL